MTHRVVVVAGDGIGPQVVAAAVRCVEATGVAIAWQRFEISGGTLPPGLVDAAREYGAVLKGPVASAGGRSPNLVLRDELGLVLGIRPCRGRGRDVVVARMLAGDLYAGIEFAAGSIEADRLRELVPALPADAAVGLKPISRAASLGAARAAFEWAAEHGRRRVTVAHKATVMKATDGLFLAAARELAPEFPALECDDRLVDAVCHDLVTGRGDIDVLLAPMLYGDLLSDLCAGLTGGLGGAPGANLGPHCAVFEAVHGTALRHAERGTASPIAMIRCAAMLLEHLGEHEAAARLQAATDAVFDGGGSRGVEAERDAVLAWLSSAG